MKKLFSYILFTITLSVNSVYGQSGRFMNAFDLVASEVDSLLYFQALDKLRGRESSFPQDKQTLLIYYQALASQYCLNQMPDSAIAAINKGFAISSRNENEEETDLSHYNAQPAAQYILERAKNERILMFNEAQHISEHRIFVKSLLEDLYRIGFRYLALETLNEFYANQWNQYNSKIDINILPTVKGEWGYYCKDPCYAEMIREAIRLGFQLWSYEPLEIPRDKRDQFMAKALSKLMTDYGDNSRVIVLGGYEHTSKYRTDNLYYYFKEVSGITPLTINQTFYRKQSAPEFERPAYRKAVELFDIQAPVVLTDATGKGFREEEEDIFVFQPREKTIHDRPAWLLENGKRKPLAVSGIDRPVILKAYHVNECGTGAAISSTSRIPVDIVNIEYPQKDKKYYLLLPKGLFLIQHQDMEGRILKEYYHQIKK